MKMKFLFPVFVIVMLISIPARLFAEERLSLQTAISMSLKNDRKYKINIERTTETRKKVLESWGGLWPQLQSDVGYSKQSFKQGLTSPMKDEFRITFVNGLLKINPGEFYNNLQSSRDAHIVAEYTARQTRAETILQAINYFYQLIFSEDNVELEKWSSQALKENFNIIAAGERKGLFTKFDYLQAKVSYYNEQTKLINAENTLNNDRANLNLYIGRGIYSKLSVDRKSIDETLNDVPNYLVDEKTEQRLVDNFIASALRNRPEVFKFKYNKQMELHTAQASESYYLWPTFSISGSYGENQFGREQQSTTSKETSLLSSSNSFSTLNNIRTSQKANVEKLQPFWSISLGATYRWGSWLPIDTYNAKEAQARSRARQHELELEDFVQSVSMEIQKAYLQLKSASLSLSWQKGNAKTADDLYKTAVQQFKSGTINNTMLLEANTSLTTAKSLFIQALHDFQQAKAMLNKAIGEDYFPY